MFLARATRGLTQTHALVAEAEAEAATATTTTMKHN